MSKKSINPFFIPPEYFIILFLIVITLSVYWQTFSYDFVSFDDYTYVYKNSHIQDGLTWEGFRWAFSTGVISGFAPDIWIPLTYLSHMLVIELFGMNPTSHHLANLALHLLNTVLLFWVLRRMTGRIWPSATVAVLFALHPLQVESVAWVTERKGLLSTLFFLLSLGAYVRYIERPGVIRYFLIVIAFALCIMAKPALITFPFVLLLLDYWPLDRLPLSDWRTSEGWKVLGKRFAEKVPLLVLTFLSMGITYAAMQRWGLISSSEEYSLGIRLANALVFYATYLQKTVWPSGLAMFYPHPGADLLLWHVVGAGGVLVGISVLIVIRMRSCPYLIVGWLWFLGVLVPVIGLVQVSSRGMADRYTYVPLIGIFIILAWGVMELSEQWTYRKPVLSAAAGLVIVLSMMTAARQVSFWETSISLFEHAVKVTENNYLAHTNLGYEYRLQGRTNEALKEFETATKIDSAEFIPRIQMGLTFSDLGRFEDAVEQYRIALRINPDHADSYYYLGKAYGRLGRTGEAIREFQTALRLRPDHHKAHGWLGLANLKAGFRERAFSEIQLAISLAPDDPDHYIQLGLYYLDESRAVEAMTAFQEAIKRDPKSTAAYNNLGLIYKDQGKPDAAIDAYRMAIQLDPDASEPHVNLALIYARQERYSEAIQAYLIGLKQDPGNFAAEYNLGLAYERLGNYQNAQNHYQKALRIQDGDERTRNALERIANPSN